MNKISDAQAEEIVKDALRQLGCEINVPQLSEATREMRLIGSTAVIDSMGIVSLLADIEMRVSEVTGADVVLADEKAMSSARSPFRTVDSLIKYIVEISNRP